MYYWHALPDGWESMEYRRFLTRTPGADGKSHQDSYEKFQKEALPKTHAAGLTLHK